MGVIGRLSAQGGPQSPPSPNFMNSLGTRRGGGGGGGKAALRFSPGSPGMVHSASSPAQVLSSLFGFHFCIFAKILVLFAPTSELAIGKIGTNVDHGDEYCTTSLGVSVGERARLMHPNNSATLP